MFCLVSCFVFSFLKKKYTLVVHTRLVILCLNLNQELNDKIRLPMSNPTLALRFEVYEIQPLFYIIKHLSFYFNLSIYLTLPYYLHPKVAVNWCNESRLSLHSSFTIPNSYMESICKSYSNFNC